MKIFNILLAGMLFSAGAAVASAQESNSTPITTPATDAAHPGAVDAKPKGIEKPGDAVTPVANATSTAQAMDTPGDMTKPDSLEKSEQKDQKKAKKAEATEKAKADKADAKAAKHSSKSPDPSQSTTPQPKP